MVEAPESLIYSLKWGIPVNSAYYWLDLLVGFGSPVLLYLLYKAGKVGRGDWRLFWIGASVGLSWEIPIFLMSKLTSIPVIVWATEPPVNYLVLMICHTLWDGALFVAGVWVVRLFCAPPTFTRFRWAELAVLLAWGQFTALLVELSSITNDAWIYVEGYWWNPTLFKIGGDPITLMIHPIWFVATVVFYWVAVRVSQSGGVDKS